MYSMPCASCPSLPVIPPPIPGAPAGCTPPNDWAVLVRGTAAEPTTRQHFSVLSSAGVWRSENLLLAAAGGNYDAKVEVLWWSAQSKWVLRIAGTVGSFTDKLLISTGAGFPGPLDAAGWTSVSIPGGTASTSLSARHIVELADGTIALQRSSGSLSIYNGTSWSTQSVPGFPGSQLSSLLRAPCDEPLVQVNYQYSSGVTVYRAVPPFASWLTQNLKPASTGVDAMVQLVKLGSKDLRALTRNQTGADCPLEIWKSADAGISWAFLSRPFGSVVGCGSGDVPRHRLARLGNGWWGGDLDNFTLASHRPAVTLDWTTFTVGARIDGGYVPVAIADPIDPNSMWSGDRSLPSGHSSLRKFTMAFPTGDVAPTLTAGALAPQPGTGSLDCPITSYDSRTPSIANNGYAHARYRATWNCATPGWGTPVLLETWTARTRAAGVNTWNYTTGCIAEAVFCTAAGTGDYNDVIGQACASCVP